MLGSVTNKVPLPTYVFVHEHFVHNVVTMDQISKFNVVHRFEKRSLLIAINCVAGLSIFFFGYDQGMMGGVNGAYDYYHNTMKFGTEDPETHEPIVQDALLQGGIV